MELVPSVCDLCRGDRSLRSLAHDECFRSVFDGMLVHVLNCHDRLCFALEFSVPASLGSAAAVDPASFVDLEAEGASGLVQGGFVFGASFVVASEPLVCFPEDGCAGPGSANHEVVDAGVVLSQVIIESLVAECFVADFVCEVCVMSPILEVV